MVGRDQVPGLVLLAVGIAVLVAAVGVGYLAALPPEYHHHVYRTTDPPTGADVGRYEELSPEAQHVFRAALDEPDDTYTTTDRSALPPELRYGDDPNQQYVRYDGATYGLVGTGGDAAFRGLFGLVAAACLLVGGAFAGLGSLSFRRRSPAVPLAVTGGAVLVVVLLWAAARTPIPPGLVLPATLAALVVGAVAYWLSSRQGTP